MELRNLDDVIGDYSGLSRKVLEYSQIMKRLVDEAKQPGFSAESWAPLADLVNTETFQRVGNFKEVMSWDQYIAFLTPWAMSSEWECSFKRITEGDNVVLLELEERSKIGGHASVVNSVSVYEYDATGRIAHLDIYLQMELPPAEMLQSYAGIDIQG